jgi:phosphopantothenoylcysteine synthetase/decarboxylase
MEEIEISSWVTLDAIKKKAELHETVGNLQTGHSTSVFCQIEEDYLELVYTDTASNCLRRYEDKDEFEIGIQQRKEEDGEAPYDEDKEFDDKNFDEDDDEDDDFDSEDDEDEEDEDEET